MNHSIHSADRATHLKIVVVALVAGIAVAGLAISARTRLGLQPDRPCHQGGQTGGGDQLGYLDGSLGPTKVPSQDRKCRLPSGLSMRNTAVPPGSAFVILRPLSAIEMMARETGLEPAASAVTGRRSNQLSYSRGCRNQGLIRTGVRA